MAHTIGTTEYDGASTLRNCGCGVWTAPHARLIDRTDRKRLPIGDDGFVTAIAGSTVVDKTLFIADVLDSNYKVTLFCRPRRFGKTFNMTMLKAYLEAPQAGGLSRAQAEATFAGTEIWEAHEGRYQASCGAYPVVYLSLRTAKGDTWDETLAALKNLITAEYQRHGELAESGALSEAQRTYVRRIQEGVASTADYRSSLLNLTTLLRLHHGLHVVVLIDEYDAPVMAGYSADNGGYYREVVGFLKSWLTGALKDGGAALAFACLTGVQRISKESIFSDLNNMVVSTSLDTRFEERFGFTDAEVSALMDYLGHHDSMEEAREWYDGYRFGNRSVYNPWSVLNYLDGGCRPRDYWGNTSSNTVLGSFVSRADESTMNDLYRLCEPGGVVYAPLDLGVVFPDADATSGALWSMLYLAGYLTSEEPEHYGDQLLAPYPLRIPNREVETLYRREIVERFTRVVGGTNRYYRIHESLYRGDQTALGRALQEAVLQSTSFYDLVSENSAHMLMVGLCYGMRGYRPPVSNSERGYGRFDLQLVPDGSRPQNPLITMEFKFQKGDGLVDARAKDEAMRLALDALEQIAAKGYDLPTGLDSDAFGRLRWGIAFCGKHVAAVCERVG